MKGWYCLVLKLKIKHTSDLARSCQQKRGICFIRDFFNILFFQPSSLAPTLPPRKKEKKKAIALVRKITLESNLLLQQLFERLMHLIPLCMSFA